MDVYEQRVLFVIPHRRALTSVNQHARCCTSTLSGDTSDVSVPSALTR